MSATELHRLGGFDGTSNVLAGKLTGIQISGTHAHAFIMCYTGLADLQFTTLCKCGSTVPEEFVSLVLDYRARLNCMSTNNGELAAFISYAQSFPHNFLCLIDTYDVVHSGLLNYLCVGAALHDFGYQPRGIRLDSGDLSYLSKFCRRKLRETDELLGHSTPVFGCNTIVASNDINEEVLISLNRQNHEIDAFGIGTHLVTCQSQPALGCVYKLVEVNSQPRIKLSQEVEKLVIPCSKEVYRLYGKDDIPILDLMQASSEPVPLPGQRLLCRHPFLENLRAYVTPSKVEPLLKLVWDGTTGYQYPLKTLQESRERCQQQLASLREDHIRSLNATPYKVSVSSSLYQYMHQLWLEEAPVADLF